MQIQHIEAIPVAYDLPKGQAIGDARGRVNSRSTTLLRLETSDGLVGWGEAFAPGRTTKALVEEQFVDEVIGMDPFEVESLVDRSYTEGYHFGGGPFRQSVVSAIDIAAWDIIGKAVGKPIHRLLGGTVTESVTPYATTMYITECEQDPAEPMKRAASEGFKAAKIKIGRNIEDDIVRVKIAREVLGDDALLMVDVNGNYDPKRAIQLEEAIKPYDIRWIEEPVPPENSSGYRQIQQHVTTPIATGEAHFGRFEFKRLIDDHLVDIVQPNVTRCGGLSEARTIAKLATTENITVVPHVWNSAVGMAAALQFLASVSKYPHTRHIPDPPLFEFDRHPNPLREDFLETPFDPTGGSLPVPQEPGLGVKINESAIKEYRID